MPKAKPHMAIASQIYSNEKPQLVVPRDTPGRRHRASITQAMSELGEVIYGVRTYHNLIKVGYTANFRNRMTGYHINRKNIAERLLFLVPGTLEDEQAIHSWLQPYVAIGREYYHLRPEVLEFVNEMRANWGISPLAA